MCGIAAIVGTQLDPGTDRIERMTEQLAHRGPDANGYLRFPGCELGHRRLSIIDLSTGAQPMTDASGRYGITFNGEIYNYQELRAELENLGHRFKTHSDTETILASYAQWGVACLDRFRGMFAFAIWDSRERRLFAARDLFGEKPLFYAHLSDGAFLAASEIKALLASELCEPRLNPATLDAYLVLGYVPPDRTVYRDIHTLPPAHYLEWSAGSLTVRRYWTPRLTSQVLPIDEAAEELSRLLRQAIRRQMVADVPVGAFLSGGLDSSTIVALMQQASPRPVKTFSVGFGSMINELPYARAVAQRYQTDHHEIDLGEPPVPEMLYKTAEVYDEPFADSSGIPTYLISEFARRHVKVVLSGDGGDELFAGYPWYQRFARMQRMAPSRLRWAALRAASRLVGDRIAWLNEYSDLLGLATRMPDLGRRTALIHTNFFEEQRRRLWADRSGEVVGFSLSDSFAPPADVAGLNRVFYHDLVCYLPADILVKVDRASMAHGLETRAPFLDRDVAEFMLSVHPQLKVSATHTKILMRRACASLWPPELSDRGKQGFGVPYAMWLGLPKVQALLRDVFAKTSPLTHVLPGARRYDYSQRNFPTWILLSLGLWLDRHPFTI
jgi:asparagine synthase (glutamine-hydrolysing)